MTSYSLPFRGAPPNRCDWVLRQKFSFDPQRWQRELGDPKLWPTELEDCPLGDHWPNVDRARVFTVGQRALTPEGAAHTYVAASVWGVGTRARLVSRRARPFISARAKRHSDRTVGERLATAVEILRNDSGGPVAAYNALHGAGDHCVTDIGPSFGTKLLYFAGFDQTPGDWQPLILDQYVAMALNTLCGFQWPERNGGWTVQQYRTYLDLAHSWAAEWDTQPDVVERALFAVGKAPALAVSVLTGRPIAVFEASPSRSENP